MALEDLLEQWHRHCEECPQCRAWARQDWTARHDPSRSPCLEGESFISRVAEELQ